MGVLQKTFAQLYQAVSLSVYATSSPDATQAAAAKIIVNDGYRAFLSAYDWTFLTPKSTLTLWPTITTGVVTVSGAGNTILTSATSCFYPSVVGRTITAADGGSYTISAYTSATVVTVTASAAADTGKVFTITANGDYGLPADYSSPKDDPVFSSPFVAPRKLVQVTPEDIYAMRAPDATLSGIPRFWALQARAYTNTDGQRYDMLVWPIPSSVTTFIHCYEIDPNEMTADGELPLGGPRHAMAIEAAAMMYAERSKGLVTGPWHLAFYGSDPTRPGLLADSKKADNDLRPRNLGESTDSSDGPENIPLFRAEPWSHT